MLRVAQAQGATVAALPENFAFMGRGEEAKLAIAETPGEGPIQSFLAATARELGLWVVAGTVPLKVAAETRVAAACLVYDAQGRVVARYDKIHLFDVDVPGKAESHRESRSVRPGASPVVVDTPAGRLGLAICYDVRFPELFRALLAQGAEWFCLPSAFTVPTGRAHWEILLRARAIENLCHLVAPAQSGFPRERPRDPRRFDDRRAMGSRAGTIAARNRRDHGRIGPRAGSAACGRIFRPWRTGGCRSPHLARNHETEHSTATVRPPAGRARRRARAKRSARRRAHRAAASGRARREPRRARARRRHGARRGLRRHLLPAHARGVLGTRGRHRQGRGARDRAGRGRARTRRGKDRLRVFRRGDAAGVARGRARGARHLALGQRRFGAGLARDGRPPALLGGRSGRDACRRRQGQVARADRPRGPCARPAHLAGHGEPVRRRTTRCW